MLWFALPCGVHTFIKRDLIHTSVSPLASIHDGPHQWRTSARTGEQA